MEDSRVLTLARRPRATLSDAVRGRIRVWWLRCRRWFLTLIGRCTHCGSAIQTAVRSSPYFYLTGDYEIGKVCVKGCVFVVKKRVKGAAPDLEYTRRYLEG